jgi:hypothetical protein
MTGIRYVTDERGRKVAVEIDLRQHKALWEEIHDTLVARARNNEKSIPLEEDKASLLKRRRLAK